MSFRFRGVSPGLSVAKALGCGAPSHDGWYRDLSFLPEASLEFDPTIADVHTDIGGELPVSRPPSVLHVGTGHPRPMIVGVDTCSGPRAYAGVAFSYHEHATRGLDRLTDEEWAARITAAPGPDVPWLEPVLGWR